MTEVWTTSLGDSGVMTQGWCIHGVAYGPHWRCAQCSPGSVAEPMTVGGGWGSYGGITAVAAPDYGDLFATLDRMTAAQLREFVRRFRDRYSL
jgi:hypothetical protein